MRPDHSICYPVLRVRRERPSPAIPINGVSRLNIAMDIIVTLHTICTCIFQMEFMQIPLPCTYICRSPSDKICPLYVLRDIVLFIGVKGSLVVTLKTEHKIIPESRGS